nr:hypothetical protein [Tanacetum cinerariifolium]
VEVHENYDNNEIFNMFTQEDHYTELLEPILEPQQVPQNDNNDISEVTDVEQDGETEVVDPTMYVDVASDKNFLGVSAMSEDPRLEGESKLKLNWKFECNKESKKMQKTILKQNYENFAASSQEGPDKTYDRTNVECYNCHRKGNFARECRAPRNKGNINRDAPTRNASVDTSTTNALVVQDGIDKTGLGYDGHVNESKVLNNVVNSCENDGDDNQVNDRFKKSEGYHAVPPPYNGNYMPSRPDLSFTGLDNDVLSLKYSAPIIEDWKSDSEDENVFESKEVKKTVKPSLEKIEFVYARNTTVENENKVEKPKKFSQSPRGNKRN